MEKEYISDSDSLEYSYERFINENNKIINKVLNVVLWFTTLSGPLIAVFVAMDIYVSMTYISCLITTVLSVGLAAVHTFLIKKNPKSLVARYIVLIGLEVILVYMRYANINVVILLFIPPLLSLLYCDRRLYNIISIISFVGLIIGVALSAEHWASYISGEEPVHWFIAHVSGYALEFALTYIAGLMISFLINWHMGTTFSDKMVIRDKEREIYTDKMTGLWNKMYLQKAYVKYVIQQQKFCSLVIIDLDNFKEINDTYGHAEGDRALTSFARVFEKSMDSIERVILCRFGGDEFIAFIPGFDREDALQNVLMHLKTQMKQAFEKDEHLNRITMSIGAYIMKNEFEDYAEIFNKADNSVLYVKNRGKNNYHIYHEGDPIEHERAGR